MIDLRYKPYLLPQVHMPFDAVLQKLDDEGIKYEVLKVDPNELVASQGVTFSDEVGKVDLKDEKPIWVGENNNVLDGHHRWVKSMLDQQPILVVKLHMNDKDACRHLNKIQDIYEYEEAQQMEEVVSQDAINIVDNDKDAGFSDEEFLMSLEEDNTAIQSEKPTLNNKTLIAYRKEPVRENSVVGNFFMLKPQDGFGKYEIEFDNLLDVGKLGVSYKEGQVPVEILAKIWFPNVNFEKISGQYDMPSVNLMNKAVANKAMKMGYDGIKYGDTIVQGLK